MFRTHGMSILVGLALLGCAEEDLPEEELATDTSELEGGGVSSCYPQAVLLTGYDSHTGATSRCTGVLVAGDLVVTAAHCFMNRGGPPLSEASNSHYQMTTLGTVYIHPEFNVCQPIDSSYATRSNRDLAVVRVNANLIYPGYQPAALATTPPAVGATLKAIGYGQPTYERRMGSFNVTALRSPGYLDVSGVGAGFCSGDSGGALFAATKGCGTDAPPTAFGIVSAADSSCASGAPAVAASLADPANAAFVQSVIAGTAAPNTAHCCPVPGETEACSMGACMGTRTCGTDRRWGACVTTTCGGGGGDGGGWGGGGWGGGGGCYEMIEVYGSDVCAGGSGSAFFCATDPWGFNWAYIDGNIDCPAL